MTILILRHSAENTLGHLAEVLDAHGRSHAYVEAYNFNESDFPMPDVLEGLVILGGAMNVDDIRHYPFLQREQNFIRAVMDREIPIFGICLGAQMIARSLGAVVERSPVKEVGWTPIRLSVAGAEDPVLSVLGDGTCQFQWHEDTYHLPPGAINLAWNPDCPQQAFRLGKNVYGVQFHPEVTEGVIQDWLLASHSLSPGQVDAIRAETQAKGAQWQQLSRAMFSRFCEVALAS